jgi:hypothetical protein
VEELLVRALLVLVRHFRGSGYCARRMVASAHIVHNVRVHNCLPQIYHLRDKLDHPLVALGPLLLVRQRVPILALVLPGQEMVLPGQVLSHVPSLAGPLPAGPLPQQVPFLIRYPNRPHIPRHIRVCE